MSLNPRITDWRGKRVWLLGASSGIGEALARALAAQGARLVLSARNGEALARLGAALPGEDRLTISCDATNPGQLEQACAEVMTAWGGIDVAIYLAGDYIPLNAWDFTPATVRRLCEVNYLGAVNFAYAVLPMLPHEGRGGLALVSSVAAYRGLPKALGYGAAKAALSYFAECLYLDLHPRGVGVWVVNPGFVATRLTAQNDFRMPALVTPEVAAEAFLDGMAAGDFEIHFPRRFTWFMKLLRRLPDCIYFRLVSRTTGA